MVRQIQDLTSHFRPFLDELIGILTAPDEENSIMKILIFNAIRLVAIFVLIGFVYFVASIIQNFVGTEIVQEEEI